MKPMLARTVGPKFNQYPCFVQPKLNGIRALYHANQFQSRDEKLWQAPVLAHLTRSLSTIPQLDRFILDGELYVHGWKLQSINGAVAVNRSLPREDTHVVQYHIFDCIDRENPRASFGERHMELRSVLLQGVLSPSIQIVRTAGCDNATESDAHFAYFTSLGYEGIMLRPDGPYEPGRRSRHLWKRKLWLDSEFPCIGFTRGQGKADIGIGALTCAIDNPYGSLFEVGTGFDDSERVEFLRNPPIGKQIKVRYIGLSDAGIPLNPSFLCVM